MTHGEPRFENYLLPTLTVSDCKAAIAFYKKAFGATELMCVCDPDGKLVAEMAVGSARFIIADESPENGNLSADKLPGVSVRLGLMVADPDAVAETAIEAGAKTVYSVADQDYGYRLGHFIDPFGHHWEIGKPLNP
jgi:PhnB protein